MSEIILQISRNHVSLQVEKFVLNNCRYKQNSKNLFLSIVFDIIRVSNTDLIK